MMVTIWIHLLVRGLKDWVGIGLSIGSALFKLLRIGFLWRQSGRHLRDLKPPDLLIVTAVTSRLKCRVPPLPRWVLSTQP